MTTQARVDAGIPSGGQFASTAHAEPTLGLGLPIQIDGLPSPAAQAAMLDLVTRRGENLPGLGPDVRIVMASNPPADD